MTMFVVCFVSNFRPDGALKKRSPSPIVFDKTKNTSIVETKTLRADIPDELPIVHPPLSIKNKERYDK